MDGYRYEKEILCLKDTAMQLHQPLEQEPEEACQMWGGGSGTNGKDLFYFLYMQ